MAYKEKSPIPIVEGGTNATTMATTDGVVYYDGTRLVTTAVGTATNVLTSNGAGLAPTFQALPSSSITITGNTGGPLTGTSFTFTGGTTGLSFGGAGTTETLTFAGITANGGTVSLATDATTSTINVGTGAGVKTSTFGSTNSTSATTVQSGSGALNVTSTNGALTINSGTGALGISTDASATTVTIANAAAVKSVTIGSINTSSSTSIFAGTGNMSLGTGSTGTISITTSGGAVNVSTDSVNNTVNIATGTAVKTLILGSTQSTSTTTVQSGSGALNVKSTNGALTINSGTGALGISTDASATTISIGTGAAVKGITLGSTNTTSSTAIKSGSGNVILNTGLTVDSTGRMTNGVQPAFFAYPAGTTNNFTGGGGNATLPFDTALYNQGSNYNTGTYTFTAPVTGLYCFFYQIYLGNVSTATDTFILMQTTAATYSSNYCKLSNIQASGFAQISSSLVVPMTAGDNCFLQINCSGQATTVTFEGADKACHFGGYLVC